MQKALLTVSFGTSYPEADRECIRPVEAALAAAFPDFECRRAFTSRFIVRKLRAQGVDIEDESGAIRRLRDDGYGDIRIVPTHIIRGAEYEKIAETAGGLPVSEPLLETREDLCWLAELLGGIARAEGRTLLAMGHGTEHAADETYARLRAELPENVRLSCVEGEHSLDGILPQLDALPEKELVLMPLMLVAGDHAHNDLAGEEPTSWKSILQARGFDVRVRMQGLGALEAVQRRFVSKAEKLMRTRD